MAEDAKPGCYTLEADAGGRVDVNARSVYVREFFPTRYLFAHVTDTHIGSGRHPRPAADIMRDIVKAVNEAGPAFVLITGDLTEDGTMDQFRTFLEIMDGCAAPTYVCAGNHDRLALHYERVFGPPAYMFCFGQDGYISFDTKDFIMADELGAQDAGLELFRRAIKPARWSIGFTHRYERMMGMRSQLTLFADNPLDHLIFGHKHRANEEGENAVPWGATSITITPAAVDGMMRLFEISAGDIKPHPPRKAAAVE